MNRFNKYSAIILICIGSILACTHNAPETLPIIGQRQVVNGDTLYPTIRDFSFINQDSQVVTNEDFNDKIYIADFFFISCPTICPKVKQQMLRIQERFGDEESLKMISHSIDTKRDTVDRLKAYAKKIHINTHQWTLVTGDKDSIYSIADDYFSIAQEDPEAPGGFNHSGRLILVDPRRRVRSFCDGTDPEDVDRFMDDISLLLDEVKK